MPLLGSTRTLSPTVGGSIVRVYNAAGFDSLFGEKLVGMRHAEDGRLT